MSNVSYQLHHVQDGIAYVLETFDLTKPYGPGILVRAGQIVNANAEGIVSATRCISMPERQAIEMGLIKAD